jgi:hypothetical protein
MKTGKAFVAGVIGAVVMSAILWVARNAMGVPAHVETMLGTLVVPTPALTAWLVGFAIHLLIGGVIAIVYAWAFEHVTHRAGWLVGVGFGLLTALVTGLVLTIIPAIHPLIPERMSAPGMFMANLGIIGIVAWYALHAIYGAIVGGMYGPVVREPVMREPVMRERPV